MAQTLPHLPDLVGAVLPGRRPAQLTPLVGQLSTRRYYRLVLDATPLVGTLGRACYAPCEGECTRGSLEGTLPIRRLKRYASDAHDASGSDNGVERPEPNGRSVAIVGSGPTGLTAAWQLARLGYAVKIFEAAPAAEPGPGYSNTRELGLLVYTHYAYAFEVSAVILLVAIIAAIALTLRRRKDSRYQNPAEQVKVRREDRVRLVSMPPERDE